MTPPQEENQITPGLYLVATPIGNLKDITFRAIDTLKSVDMILAEDTRTSSVLLKHYQINAQLKSYHIHNEHKILQEVMQWLKQGKSIALISDAGSPAISDPGFLLVRECIEQGVQVFSIPGPVALISALQISGLPTDRFVFEGFLPPKKGRQSRLQALAEENRTIVLYESPHKLLKTLQQLAEALGKDRQACVARELTKLYEQKNTLSLERLVELYTKQAPKGEFVICIAGK